VWGASNGWNSVSAYRELKPNKPAHTCTYGSNGKCTDKNCGATFMGDDGTHYYGKDIVSGFKGEIGIYKKSGSGGVDAYTAPNMNSIYQKEITTKA
jgi:hypothetical protein